MSRLPRKTAQPIDELIKLVLRSNGLAYGHNTQKIFEAWDNVSCAGNYTLKKYFRSGKLYITLSNSAVRSQLFFQKDDLKDRINASLLEDPMFIKEVSGAGPVNEIILK